MSMCWMIQLRKEPSRTKRFMKDFIKMKLIFVMPKEFVVAKSDGMASLARFLIVTVPMILYLAVEEEGAKRMVVNAKYPSPEIIAKKEVMSAP